MTVIPGEEQAVRGGLNLNPYDQSFRQNPGTRVTLSNDPLFTNPNVLKRPFGFPAPPLDQLQISGSFNWGDYDTVSAGQFSRPSGMQLRTLSFDTIFTNDDYPWQFYNTLRVRAQDCIDMAKELESIMASGTPIRMKIQNVEYKASTGGIGFDFGPRPVLQMLCTLRAVSWTEKEGEPGCVYVTVGFSEHRIPGATQRKLGAGVKGGASGRGTPARIGLKVFQGANAPKQNTLAELAVAYYGSAAKWREILKANPWLGNLSATHDLGVWDTAALKTAGKANRLLTIPKTS